MTIIYGIHGVLSCLQSNVQNIDTIFIKEQNNNSRIKIIVDLAYKNNISIEYVVIAQINKLTNNANHQDVALKLMDIDRKPQALSITDIMKIIKDKLNAVIVIIDNITDPHNLGAIIRTCDCFAIDAIILPKNNCANINNPVVIKTSSGAIFNIPIITVSNLNNTIDILKEHDFWVYGTALHDKTKSLYNCDIHHKSAWIVGSEGAGIRRLVLENCDYLVTIPMYGKTQSLNVSVATGVMLSHIKYQSLLLNNTKTQE